MYLCSHGDLRVMGGWLPPLFMQAPCRGGVSLQGLSIRAVAAHSHGLQHTRRHARGGR